MSFIRFMIKNKEIIPVLTAAGFASTLGVVMLIRSALTSPDAIFDKANNPTPWLNVKPTEQIKLYSPSLDFKTLKTDRPNIDD